MPSKGFRPCQTCLRVQCSCPPEEPQKSLHEFVDELAKPTRRATKAVTEGEKLARYGEQHLCVGCIHALVCEVGRHTAELFTQSWLVVIADCSNYVSMEDEENEV